MLEQNVSPVLGDLKLDNCDPDCRKRYFNRDTTEILELFFYPGRKKNQVSYFKVSLTTKTNIKIADSIPKLDVKSFVSGKGIKLLDGYDKINSMFN